MFDTFAALGVILLEIGLRSRADELDNGYLIKNVASHPKGVKDRLLRHADLRVGFFAGDGYREAVLGCLTGAMMNVPIEEACPAVVKRLGEAASCL